MSASLLPLSLAGFGHGRKLEGRSLRKLRIEIRADFVPISAQKSAAESKHRLCWPSARKPREDVAARESAGRAFNRQRTISVVETARRQVGKNLGAGTGWGLLIPAPK